MARQKTHVAAVARELEELIAALDRRVPRVEQAGEAAIAGVERFDLMIAAVPVAA